MVSGDRAQARTFVVTGVPRQGSVSPRPNACWPKAAVVVGADVAAPRLISARTSHFVTADVTDEAAIAALLAAVPDRLDGVVHAAGRRRRRSRSTYSIAPNGNG